MSAFCSLLLGVILLQHAQAFWCPSGTCEYPCISNIRQPDGKGIACQAGEYKWKNCGWDCCLNYVWQHACQRGNAGWSDEAFRTSWKNHFYGSDISTCSQHKSSSASWLVSYIHGLPQCYLIKKCEFEAPKCADNPLTPLSRATGATTAKMLRFGSTGLNALGGAAKNPKVAFVLKSGGMMLGMAQDTPVTKAEIANMIDAKVATEINHLRVCLKQGITNLAVGFFSSNVGQIKGKVYDLAITPSSDTTRRDTLSTLIVDSLCNSFGEDLDKVGALDTLEANLQMFPDVQKLADLCASTAMQWIGRIKEGESATTTTVSIESQLQRTMFQVLQWTVKGVDRVVKKGETNCQISGPHVPAEKRTQLNHQFVLPAAVLNHGANGAEIFTTALLLYPDTYGSWVSADDNFAIDEISQCASTCETQIGCVGSVAYTFWGLGCALYYDNAPSVLGTSAGNAYEMMKVKNRDDVTIYLDGTKLESAPSYGTIGFGTKTHLGDCVESCVDNANCLAAGYVGTTCYGYTSSASSGTVQSGHTGATFVLVVKKATVVRRPKYRWQWTSGYSKAARMTEEQCVWDCASNSYCVALNYYTHNWWHNNCYQYHWSTSLKTGVRAESYSQAVHWDFYRASTPEIIVPTEPKPNVVMARGSVLAVERLGEHVADMGPIWVGALVVAVVASIVFILMKTRNSKMQDDSGFQSIDG